MNHTIQRCFSFARLLVVLGLILGATAFMRGQTTAALFPNQAYYVRYEPGKKIAALNQIAAIDGVVDYDLSRWQLLAVSIPGSAINRLKAAPAISTIEPVPVYEMAGEEYPFGLDMVQALDVWDFDRDGVLDADAPTGSGVKICIIDTGVFDTHKEFIATTINGISQIDEEAWNETITGHGTHVAGTVAANVQGIGLAGVAPGVELFIVKIFDNHGRWVDGESNLGAAATSCAANAADIISLSLKGEESAVEEEIFDALFKDEGIITFAAAANDGDSSGTADVLAFPASYKSVVAVAAVTSAFTHASYSNENDQVELAAPGSAVISTWPTPDNGSIPYGRVVDNEMVHVGMYIDESTPGTQSGTLIDGGLCREEDQIDDWNGKIVLCLRQDLLFREMVSNAEQKGAAATIIIWKEPGQMVGTLATGSSIGPVVMVPKETGDFLKSNKVGTIVTVETGDGSVSLPGLGGYKGLRGTSMATPHVAGAAALIWGACPELTNKELRQLLAKTAYDLGDHGWDMSFGYGLVQVFDAWHECRPADLGDSQRSYGQVRHTGNGQLRLGNFWDTDSWQGEYPGAGHDDLNDDGLVFSALSAGQDATVHVRAMGNAQNAWVSGWLDFNRDGIFGDDEMVVNGAVDLNKITQFTFSVPLTVNVDVPINYRFRLYDNVTNLGQLNALIPTDLPATISEGEAEDGTTLTIPTAVTLHSLSAALTKSLVIPPGLLLITGLLTISSSLILYWKRQIFRG